MRAPTRWVVWNFLSAKDACFPRKMPCLPDHPGCQRGAFVFRFQGAHLVPNHLAKMPHANVAIGFVEHRLSVRLVYSVIFAP